ncbi:hypothetical protein K1T71_006139 [Dendrolimus kikuchii]|uniref:Uncharacterized protein n=1 Tax=Dendrolimus kikuchii TaxID=765133 RepID=A0ACC1D3A2_9NEOP|nr:hypothetical protein K1T71_006139 [Dendrolimus kikuchii]
MSANSASERSDDMTKQIAVSEVNTSQPFRSKSSSHNKIKKKTVNNSCTNNIASTSTQDDLRVLNKDFANLPVKNVVTAQCQKSNIHSENGSVNPIEKTTFSKRKPSKKKEKLTQLNIPAPIIVQNQSTASNVEIKAQSGVSSVHEFFVNQIAPLYATTSSRYLENLSHHPQSQYTQNMPQLKDIVQNIQSLTSAPNTPFQQAQILVSPVTPNALISLSEPSTPKYFQNIIQHPLLSQSFKMHSTVNFHQLRGNAYIANALSNNINFKNKKKNKTDENSTNVKFEPYMSLQDVELGLKNNTLIEGVLRINPKQFQHSYVSSTDRSEQDILINGIKNRNRGLEGDVVIVQYIDDETEENGDCNKQKQGKVVLIKEKIHTRTCIGNLKLMPDKNRQKALFVPRDNRIPRLNIPFTCWPDNFYHEAKNYENTLFLAKIYDWFDIRFALGKILCNIGQSGDMKTESRAILAQTDLDVTPFGPEVRHLYPRLDYTIPEDEIKLREDCRTLCLFSIDPFNCRDIDDAVSCRALENGNYEIGVHISDVAHFLNENTLLDEKVAEKATTIYLVEKAYHMLPDELCMLCSLFPGVDKLAFSVFWEITKDAEVLNHRFSKTVIHSCCQLAYDHAQAILDNKQDAKDDFPETYNGFDYEDIYKSIKILGHIGATFRRKRFENGALRIDQPKVAFHLNAADGLPDSYWIYESKESHQLIEEFMLLANMTVANRIYNDHPKLAFLRSHPPPSGYMLQQLAKSLKPMGIDLEISSAGDLHKSLLPHVGPDSTNRGKSMVLNMLCAKPMTRAKYFCADGCDDEDFHHYALNVPLYTHFTSPIRRYADIMVHRLLAASLNYRETPKWEVDKVRMIAAQCNKQKYNSKKASELSTELYILKYIELQSPIVTEAVAVDVRDKYIDIIVVAMGLNRRIFFNNDFPGEYRCIKHEDSARLSKMELTWHATNNLQPIKQVIEVFSTLQIEMHKGDDMVKVETKLVRPRVSQS